MGVLLLLRACHPGPTATVTAVTAMLAAAAGRPGWEAVAVTAAVLAGQLSIGWGNDWIDYGRDRAVARADKPLVSGRLHVGVVRAAALLALAACVVLSLSIGAEGWLHLGAVALGWAYNHPLKNTVASVLPFAVAFGLLVAFVLPDPGWQLVAGGALLGAAAHFANVLPDLADDAATGVRGLPHRMGGRAARATAVALTAGATLLLTFSLATPAAMIAGVAAAAAMLVVGGTFPPKWTFRLVEGAALVNVALLVLTTLSAQRGWS